MLPVGKKIFTKQKVHGAGSCSAWVSGKKRGEQNRFVFLELSLLLIDCPVLRKETEERSWQCGFKSAVVFALCGIKAQ